MGQLQLLLAALAALARGRNQSDVADYLELIGLLAARGADARQDFDALRVEIEAMVAAGRDPTPTERAAVRDRRQQLSDELRNLDGEDPPPIG